VKPGLIRFPTSRQALWPLLVAVGVVTAIAPWYFYCPDDLFIHLRFAQNLIEGGEWALNPGQPAAGATSPPWVLALAALMVLGVPGLAAAKALGTATAVALVLLVGRVCRGAGAPPSLEALAMVVVAGSHWLRLWSAAGMETPLPPLLLVAAITLALRQRPWAVLAGGLLGLASWARPDALVAALVVAVLLSLRVAGRDQVRLLVAGVAVGLSWPLFSRLVLGSWLPIDVAARGSALAPEFLGPVLRQTLLMAFSELLPLAALAVVAVVVDARVRRRWRVWSVPLAAAATCPVGYCLNQAGGGPEASGRYLVPWLVLGGLAWVMILIPWWQDAVRRRLVMAAVALSLMQSVALSLVHAPVVDTYDDYHRRSLLRAARWLRTHADPGDWVAAGDAGVLAFVGDVRVFDLNGSVGFETRGWAGEGSTFEAIRELEPRFFINPPRWRTGFDLKLLEPFTVEKVFTSRHTASLLGAPPADFEITLRVLDWTGVPEIKSPGD